MLQKGYKILFWVGYLFVLLLSVVSFSKFNINDLHIGPERLRFRIDYLIHFIVYFSICMYYLVGKLNGLSLFREYSLMKFVFCVLFLALMSELLQKWIQGRTFNPFDMVSNISGLVTGVLVILIRKPE